MALPIDLEALGDSLVSLGREWVKAVNPTTADREFMLDATVGLAAITGRIRASETIGPALSAEEKQSLRREFEDYEAAFNLKIGQYAVKAGAEWEKAMSDALLQVGGLVIKAGLAALL